MATCKRRKALPQPIWLYSPTEERIPEAVNAFQLGGMHSIRSWKGHTISLGLSDVVGTIKIWRKSIRRCPHWLHNLVVQHPLSRSFKHVQISWSLGHDSFERSVLWHSLCCTTRGVNCLLRLFSATFNVGRTFCLARPTPRPSSMHRGS